MMGSRLPIVVSVPHGGVEVPAEVREYCQLSALEFALDGDLWAQDLYAFHEDVLAQVCTAVPRAIVDMNREPADRPPRNPDGVVKTVTIQGKQVWNSPDGPTPELAGRLIEEFHHGYHQSLARAAKRPGVILGLDCHTMLAVGPDAGSMEGQRRPIACVSNRGDAEGEPTSGPVTAPAKLVRALRDALQDELASEADDFSGDPVVRINEPFQGGYITRRHGQAGPTPWIQLELSRALYEPGARHVSSVPGLASRVRLRDLGRLVLVAVSRALANTSPGWPT